MDNSELQPILLFLNELAPFNTLDPDTVNRCAQALSITYYNKQQKLVHVDSNPQQLYIVRSGAFEVTTKDNELIDRVGPGQFFGFSGMLSGEKVVNQVHILEDGLVYHLPFELFNQLRGISQTFDRFFNQAFAKRLRDQGAITKNPITTSRVKQVMSQELITITAKTSIQEAAQLMSQKRLSSLVVTESDCLLGILTDRDLRSRVLAQGLTSSTLVEQVMTKTPQTIDANALTFEAMLKMSESNIHHLPVVTQGKPVAIITSTDIMRSQSNQPLLLVGEINRQNDLDGLFQVSQKIPNLLQNLIASDAKATEIGRVLTLVSDALTNRLIKIKIEQLGPPSFNFCWLVFGSQARQDQMAGADQDSALLLDRELNNKEQEYVKSLTEYVCSGLNKCGYAFCPGNIMAQNRKWQLSLTRWQEQFNSWVSTPSPKALLNATIFFDMRAIYGDKSLFEQLQSKVLSNTKKNDIFAATLTQNALRASAPLGFFKHFLLERDGRELKGIDLKHKGTALINDIVRIYALSSGIKQVSTEQRIQALMQNGYFDKSSALNLSDAWEFIAHKRLSNQGLQLNNQQKTTNYILPAQLSSLVRQQLKDAFKVIHDAQITIRLKFLRQF